MRTVFAALMISLILALGVLEVLASRTPFARYPDWHPDSVATWQAR